MAAYGLVRSLRLPWWVWTVALAAALVAGQVSAQASGPIQCPDGQAPRTTDVYDNGPSSCGFSFSEGMSVSAAQAAAVAPQGCSFPRGDGASPWVVTSCEASFNFTGTSVIGDCTRTSDGVSQTFDGYVRLACEPVPECPEQPNTWAGASVPTEEQVSAGATRCNAGCQVQAMMEISVGGDDSGKVRAGWMNTGNSCTSGMGNDVALYQEVEGPGDHKVGPINNDTLVPDSVTFPDGTVVAGPDLDDYWSYITEDHKVVQGNQAQEPLSSPPDESVTITHHNTQNTQVINFFGSGNAPNAPNAGDLDTSNSNGPGAGTFPGDGGGDPPGPGGQCDPDVEECGDSLTGGVAECSAEPTCSDESAIECAILRQIHASNCETFAGEGPGGDAVQELREHAGIAGDTDTALVEQLYRDAADMDETGFFAELTNIPGQDGQACPAPLTFQAFGETREFPLDSICQFLRLMGVFVVLASVIAGLRIAMGSSK